MSVSFLVGVFFLAVCILATAGILLSIKLTVRRYTLLTDKLSGQKTLRFALLSDLHAARYGKGQKKLLAKLRSGKPDIVLLAGDVIAEDKSREPALELLGALGKEYPCFYVTGNHEYRSGKPEEVRALARSYGITVLRGDSVLWKTADGNIRIAGIDDLQEAGFEGVLSQAKRALSRADAKDGDSLFTVFICHHPEIPVWLNETQNLAFDLAVAGHAHGGQWRLPGVINGLYAPHQGLFPKYAGGLYTLAQGALIVSRGLSGGFPIPRLFNPPELVFIDVKPV